tara:strand:- start:5035 stop:6153 length:1119 start_codon:yes stop_codon:yes gene_type:complete
MTALPLSLKSESLNTEDFSANDDIYYFLTSPQKYISENVKDTYNFYGLARYLNNITYFTFDKDKLTKVNKNETIELDESKKFLVVGRYKVLLIQADGLILSFNNSDLLINSSKEDKLLKVSLKLFSKNKLLNFDSKLDQIPYYNLWKPLAFLSKLVEYSITNIQKYIIDSWAISLIIFSILIKIILFPVNYLTLSLQRKVDQVKLKLGPKLDMIKSNFEGRDAHLKSIEAYKEFGVSPYYTLKPIWGIAIQIPILIAIFNALGEMVQFSDQSFLWIKNLAYPDIIGQLPFTVPMIGEKISALPIIMTLITVYSTTSIKNQFTSIKENKRQKYNLYFMAILFFFIFYPFPSIMVLYWTMANILQKLQQLLFKI